MALRSLDNAIPASLERPKKIAKVALPTKTPRDPSADSENPTSPPKPVDQSVEYIASEDLESLTDPEAKIKILLEELDSKDWIRVCESLNDARRLALHHSSLLLPILEKLMVVMVKAMKNPRSALCKTSIMASRDIFSAFGHHLLSASKGAAFDQLLLQLLLKASQDKKFVCEEAEKALETMAISASPLPLLRKLQTYVNHRSLRVRAKAAVAISKCVSKMDYETMEEFGLGKLLQVAAELLSDKLPEAREAARRVINSIHSGFTSHIENKESTDTEGASTADPWQDFCSSNLSVISAQSVAKVVLQ